MRLVILALTFAAVLIAACSGSDDDDGPVANPATATVSSQDQPGGGNQQATNQPTGGTTGSAPSPETSGGAVISESCPELIELLGSLSTSQPLAAAANPLFDVTFFRTAANASPDEIRGDMTVIADAFEQMAAILQDYSIDPTNMGTIASLSPAQQQDLTQRLAAINTDELEGASQKVSAYLEREC